MLKPFRQMGGQDAPGEDLGGWYMYKPDYDYRKDSAGLCPGGTFGQWVSALSRIYAITGDAETRAKVLRLNRLYAQAISSAFYEKTRFPAYSYDKLVCGLIDAHQFAGDPKPDILQADHRYRPAASAGASGQPRRAGVPERTSPTTGMNPTPYPKIFSSPISVARANVTSISPSVILTTPPISTPSRKGERPARQARLQLRQCAQLGDAGLPGAGQARNTCERRRMPSPC